MIDRSGIDLLPAVIKQAELINSFFHISELEDDQLSCSGIGEYINTRFTPRGVYFYDTAQPGAVIQVNGLKPVIIISQEWLLIGKTVT